MSEARADKPGGTGEGARQDADVEMPPRFEALLDRVNPVALRELRQVMRSRVFVIGFGIVLLAIAMTALFIGSENPDGREAFQLSSTLMLLSILIGVPMRAMTAMSKEVEPGLAEQILLTKLGPQRIVDGHLLTAALLITVLVCLFSPLIAVSYLLRGIDVEMVLSVLGFTGTVAIGSASLTIAFGALSVVKATKALGRVLAVLSVVLTLMFASAVITMFQRGFLSFGGEVPFVAVIAIWLSMLALGITLARLIGTALLSHPFENRSTGFRVHALITTAAIVAGVAIGAALSGQVLVAIINEMFGAGLPPAASTAVAALVAQALPALAPYLVAVAACTWFFAATEPEPLSPRVRTTVPPSGTLAFVLAPVYPGGGRGLLFALGHAAAIAALGVTLPLAFGLPVSTNSRAVLFLVSGYAVFYTALGRVVRGLLGQPRNPGRTWAARGVVIGVGVFGSLLPVIVDAVVVGRVEWHLGHVLNPLYTIIATTRYGAGNTGAVATIALSVMCGVVLAAALPSIRRGFAEVRQASAERRARESA